eukprot:6977465-Pyramimonas_sp.AAC.1
MAMPPFALEQLLARAADALIGGGHGALPVDPVASDFATPTLRARIIFARSPLQTGRVTALSALLRAPSRGCVGTVDP